VSSFQSFQVELDEKDIKVIVWAMINAGEEQMAILAKLENDHSAVATEIKRAIQNREADINRAWAKLPPVA